MIKILAHRRNDYNPNMAVPSDGIEVDVWSTSRGIMLGHDPEDQVGHLKYLLPAFTDKTIAINAKSNNLAAIVDLINTDTNYFIFDASVPESLHLLSKGLVIYTRQSEYELEPSFYRHADGVWMDQMQNDWVDYLALSRHKASGKGICVVSPELHGRPFKNSWVKLKEALSMDKDLDFFLCTKFPERATLYFNEQRS